jgi:SCY1-like protein 1
VLPALVSALEFAGGSASAPAVVPLLLLLGKRVPAGDYPRAVLAPLLKLFASPDRAVRMALLDALPEYADKLDKKAVNDKIWPHLQTGFGDTVAVIREATVKSLTTIAPLVRPPFPRGRMC